MRARRLGSGGIFNEVKVKLISRVHRTLTGAFLTCIVLYQILCRLITMGSLRTEAEH